MAPLRLGRPGQRLPVGHPRKLGRGLDPVLAPELLQDHLQVDVAHASDHQLVGLLPAVDTQRGVLLGQAREAGGDLLLVASALREDGEGVRRGRDRDLRDCAVRGAQQVVGQGGLELRHRRDVAGADLLGVLVFLPAWEEELAQALVAPAGHVGHGLVGLDAAAQRLEVADPPDEGVGARRAASVALGGREKVACRPKHAADSDQLGGGAADDGADLPGQDALAKPALDLLLGQRAFVQVLLEEAVVALGGRFDQLLTALFDHRRHVVGDRRLRLLAVRRRDVRLEAHQVHRALEGRLGADRQVQRHRPRRQLSPQRFEHAEVVGVLLVHLVDDHQPRLLVPVQPTPADLGADADGARGADHEQRALGHRQGARDLATEVEEPRGVQEVDLEAVQLHVRHREVDGDPTLLLLRLEVEHGGSSLGGAHPTDRPRGEEHAFGERGLAFV